MQFWLCCDLCCDFSTVWTVVKTVLRTNGLLGFYQGLTSTIAREVPGYFCFFGAYELCRSKVAEYMGTDKDGIGMIIFGFLGSFSLWCVHVLAISFYNTYLCRCSSTHVQWRIWWSMFLVGGLSNRLCEVQDPGVLLSWETRGLHENFPGYHPYWR